jgi:hypothetical protein
MRLLRIEFDKPTVENRYTPGSAAMTFSDALNPPHLEEVLDLD